jgi:tetratricopeptide (TPR) repeat protein
MKMPALIAVIAIAITVPGCSSSPRGGGGTDPALQPNGGSDTGRNPAPNSGAGQEWDELMRRLQQQQQVAQQQQYSEADEHYRLAERYYGAGDLDKAEVECRKALELNSNHAPANALLLEVNFLQGRGQETPASEVYQKIIQEAVVRHQQMLLEIDDKLSAGIRAYNAAYYDEAERSFRMILEFAKWLPTGVDLETRRKQALDMLEKTKSAKRQKELDEEKARLAHIEEEQARNDLRQKIEQKRELEILFGQAQLFFEQENYSRCIDICEKILYTNPNLGSVEEMRSVATRLRHHKAERDNLKNYVEEWKRTFETIELSGVVQAEELSFAARELWFEFIAKRKPKGI